MKGKQKTAMTVAEFKEKEMGPLWEIFDFCTNLPMSVYADTLGVKLPEACYRSSPISRDSRLASEEYLLNAKRSSLDMALPIGVFSYASLGVRGSLSFRQFKERDINEREGASVALPPYLKINAPLGAVIRSRRSVREMSGKSLSMEELSSVLFYGDGVTGDFNHAPGGGEFPVTETLGDKYVSKVRAAPSGGGLYPVYLYAVVLNVDGLKPGIYQYMPITHALEIVRIFDARDMDRLREIANWGNNISLESIDVAMFYVYSLYENSRKYVDMGLTFALIEAGEISENIHLACTAMGLASCDIGGYDKVPCESFLGVDGLTRHMIHLTLIGK
ncbi:MAG: SagB family peptide dehydrogenase [Spirochaetia bacterium]|nr:SagB family peptide dehydrogenase [Spirochaetia bacterium]